MKSWEAAEQQTAEPRLKVRPPNAYILYCLEKRTEMRKLFPDLPNVEISRRLGVDWKKIGESEKLPYRERAKKLQESFKKENPDYRYEKARKKRAEKELIFKSSPVCKPAVMALPDNTLDFSALVASFQEKISTPPQSQAVFGDFHFGSDMFDNHAQ